MVEFFSLDGESSTPVVHKVYRCFHCRGIRFFDQKATVFQAL